MKLIIYNYNQLIKNVKKTIQVLSPRANRYQGCQTTFLQKKSQVSKNDIMIKNIDSLTLTLQFT